MDYEQFLKQVAEDLKYSIPNASIEMSDTLFVWGICPGRRGYFTARNLNSSLDNMEGI